MLRRLLILDPGNFTPAYDVKLAEALIDRGWDVTWITSPHQFDQIPSTQRLKVQEAFFGHLRRLPLEQLNTSKRLAMLVRMIAKGVLYPLDLAKFHSSLCRLEPGIIHVQWALLPFLDLVFWRKWRKKGWIVVFTVHDPTPLAGTTFKLFWHHATKLCSEANAVVVHGQYARKVLTDSGVNNGRIYLQAPGSTLLGRPIERTEARKALALDMDVPVVLFFGYIKEYKGLHVLLESLSLVKAALGKVVLLVAGELKEPRSKYQKLILHLDLEKEVHWFEGYIPDRYSPFYFAAADLVVLPYLEASSSGVLLTAYSCGRAVVASSVGGIPEQVEDGVTGALVPPGDRKALADAMIRILGDLQLAEMMGARGLQLVREKFNWVDIAGSAETLYLHLWNKAG